MKHELPVDQGIQAGMADITGPLMTALVVAVRRDGLQFPIHYEVTASDYSYLAGVFRQVDGKVEHEQTSRYSPEGKLVPPVEIKFWDQQRRESHTVLKVERKPENAD